MKKTMIKKALLSLSIAFAVSAAVGVNALTANAEEAINPAFASLALQNGASIRYAQEGEEATQEGFSYVLEMDAAAYAEVAANEAFTNVQYGILIGPEAYYDMYAFDNQANIDAYYSLNEEAEGKAFLYDMQAVEFTAGADESKVYYRGSIVELKENNLIRDYRGVGYVAYTFEGQDYKFFFTDETNVRCPVEIADLTIDTLNTEADADKIAALQANYINKIDWTITPENQAARTWTQSWGIYEIAPTYSWVSKYGNNRYINSKYITTAAYEKAGQESVAYTGWAGTGEQIAQQTDLEGVWTLTHRTTCEFLADEVVTFSKQVTFLKLGGADCDSPTVNGVKVPKSATAGSQWNEAIGGYNLVDPGSWAYVIPYAKKATGDFIVDFTLKSPAHEDFRIYTSDTKWVGIRTNVAGNNGFFARATEWASEANIKGTADLYTLNNGLNLRLVMYKNTLYFFGNTYTNEAGAVVERNEWLHLATMSTSGLSAANGMVYENLAHNGMATHYTNFINAATANEFGFAIASLDGSGTTNVWIDLEDNDAAVMSFINSNTTLDVDGLFVNGELAANSSATAFTQDANGYWNTESGLKVLEKASGDYMLALKLKSNNEFDFRVYYGAGKFFSIVSALSQGNSVLFMDGSYTSTWWSETRIGYNTAKFVNDNAIAAENQADGYLDVMLVRSQGVYYVYTCEYLGEDGKVATFDNWQLLIQFNADNTTPAGEGITIKDTNFNVVTATHSYLRTAVNQASTVENAFALRCRTGGGYSAKVNVVDDDAAVAAFMASEKAVAEYAKA